MRYVPSTAAGYHGVTLPGATTNLLRAGSYGVGFGAGLGLSLSRFFSTLAVFSRSSW